MTVPPSWPQPEPAAQPGPTPGTPPKAKRKWYRRKRILIPAAVVLLIAVIPRHSTTDPAAAGNAVAAPATTSAPLTTTEAPAAPEPTTTAAPDTTPAAATVSAQDPAIREAAYTGLIHAKNLGISDAAMLTIGHTICTNLQAGQDVASQALALNAAAPDKISPKDAGYVVAAAVSAFCQEQQPKMDQFVKTYGG